MSSPDNLVKWIEVDTRALLANARLVHESLGSKTKFMAVVKGDAYGHGLSGVVEWLAPTKLCDAFGVWSLEEATQVVSASHPSIPISLLVPCFEDSLKLEWGVKHGIWFCVDRREFVTKLSRAAKVVKKKAKVFLDVDFGLSRWGVPPGELLPLAKSVLRDQSIELIGIFTHLDYVPGLQKIEGEKKLQEFVALTIQVSRVLERPILRSGANTGVLLDFPDWALDLARIGNLLYGVNPTKTPFPVKNIWSFKARVVNVRYLRQGAVIGYGGEYLCPKPMRVATVLCGFGDGLTMEPAHRFIRFAGPPRYYAKFREKPLPFVGRPGIGHTLLDATGVSGLNVGDVVELPIRRTAASLRIPRIYK